VDLSYFPGCSLHSTAREYDDSTRAVCGMLGIHLTELGDWNCCGSTSAHSVNQELALLLPARNLMLAQQSGRDLMIPCAACFARSKTAAHRLSHDAQARAGAADLFGAEYENRLQVKHLLDVLADEAILAQLAEKVQNPLLGLPVVCYYGCLLVRPPKVTGATDYENPTSMDRIMEILGGKPLDWSYKTDCCGGSLVLTRADVVEKLTDRLLTHAAAAGAEAIVTACSMCQANLDLRQKETAAKFGKDYHLPVFYISELVALAMGHPGTSAWWGKHLTDPRGVLRARRLAA
jgi:heterodisulfide reductase subunit B